MYEEHSFLGKNRAALAEAMNSHRPTLELQLTCLACHQVAAERIADLHVCIVLFPTGRERHLMYCQSVPKTSLPSIVSMPETYQKLKSHRFNSCLPLLSLTMQSEMAINACECD